jgi:uncharacterized protein (TIGR02001 family)
LRSREWITSPARAAVFAAALALAFVSGGGARAQSATNTPGYSINLGGRGWFAPEIKLQGKTDGKTDGKIETIEMRPQSTTEGQTDGKPQSKPQITPEAQRGAASPIAFDFSAGLATDYIYRGTTLSDHNPSVGAAFEATFAQFYAGVAVASVKLPTQPAAEITMSAGVRPSFAGIDFDLGAFYYLYPDEQPAGGVQNTDYWEVGLRADKRLNALFHLAGELDYSPNISNSGAWSFYAAAGLGIDVPARLLPRDIAVSFTGGAGYSWFGDQSQQLGGFALPAYLNWQAGVTFTHKAVSLDLRYYDTDLSRENCFVLTGDLNGRPGGAINPVTNPEGLTSRWCSATVVAKLSFGLN